MKKTFLITILIACVWACTVTSKTKARTLDIEIPAGSYEDTLRFLYSLPPSQWPAPLVDEGVQWSELGIIPASPLNLQNDSIKRLVALGKILFFDPRLSGSNQISCATCHVPALHWTDGRQRSIGHDQQMNKRNSPTILNTWFYKQLFWDGRSKSLEDQAFSPINSETEMHSEMSDLMPKLRRIKTYTPLFDSVFGSEGISPETVTIALASFERSLVSGKAAFDQFLSGEKSAMNDAALRGLHLFRTKAGCMNCHNGPLFSDNSFHNTGLSDYQGAHEDLGRYNFTHRAADVGRFRTPSLRDVARTGPWMHNGLFNDLNMILEMYSAGMPLPGPSREQASDTLFPRTDPLIRKRNLDKKQRDDILAFLKAITGEVAGY